MICKFCATGADVQSRAIEIEDNQAFQGSLIEVGVALHARCRGKTACDCKHLKVERGKNVRT